MKALIISMLWGLLGLFATPLAASDPSALSHFNRAKEAYEAKQYERAILALEQAWRTEESPQILYWRVMTLHAMGEHEHVLELVSENREFLLQAPESGELYLLEERSRRALETREDVVKAPPNPPSLHTRSTLHTVGPIVLGALGVGLIGLSVPFWMADCAKPRGERCLEYGDANYPAAIGLSSGGALMVGGAVVWWVVGAPESPQTGALSLSVTGLRGTF